MVRELTPSEVEAAASALVVAQKSNLGVEVTMPVVYPDGRAVTVVVAVEGGEYVVHDAGFGSMYLTGAGVAFTKQIRRRLTDLAGHYGCEFIEGRMTRHCSVDQVALAVAMVANASRGVGDQTLDARRRSESEFVSAVTDRLRETIGDKRIRTNEQFKGKSGATYRIHNVILDPAERDAVAFVEPLASKSVISQRFMEFHDLKPVHRNAEMYAVLDDDDIVSKEHANLLSEVCQLVPYGQSRERFRGLAA